MTTLSRYVANLSDDKMLAVGLVLGVAFLAGYRTVSVIEQDDIRSASIIAAPLYGDAMDNFVDDLPLKPGGRVGATRINKADDRFMADIMTAAYQAFDVSNGTVTLATPAEQELYHLDDGRYDRLESLAYDIRTDFRWHSGVREFGPQAAEKLGAVKAAVREFEVLVAALKGGDLPAAEAQFRTLHASLETYIQTYHAKEHDLDRASADLMAIERGLYALEERISKAQGNAHLPAPK